MARRSRAPRIALFHTLIVTALISAACSSSASTPAPTSAVQPPATASAAVVTPPPSPTVPPSVAPTATQALPTAPAATAAAATESPTAAASAAPTTPPVPTFAIASFTSDQELEAALPAIYKGVSLTKASFKGDAATNPSSEGGKELIAVLQSLGKTPNDLSVAVATDPTGKLGVGFGAYRVKGVDAGVWAPAFYRVAQETNPGTTATDVSLGGKSVKRVVSPGTPRILYAWPKGDVLFFVGTTTDALAGDAIAAMP